MRAKWIAGSIVALLVLFVVQLTAEPSFTWGFRERVRNTYINNAFDFNADNDDEQDFFRIRTNLWGQFSLDNGLSGKLQLTNEWRHYPISYRPGQENDFEPNEIFIDNLFLSYKSQGQTPWSVTVGLQNLIYGEGFILLEGGPWDGSRAIYHNAVKFSIQPKAGWTVDVLGIQNTKFDEWPVINLEENEEFEQVLNDGKETAVGVYAVKTNPETKARYDAYYFYRREDPNPFIPVDPIMETLNLHTVGGRMVKPLNSMCTLVAEGAVQGGSFGNVDQFSWGGYAYLNRQLGDGTGTLGLMALSGDKPSTADKFEGWNPMFARWPKWSELYIYSHIQETDRGSKKVAYWTNELSPYLSYKIQATKMFNVSAFFYHRRSMHGDVTAMNDDMYVRGNEIQLWIKAKFTDHWSGHFLFDEFFPGDFYSFDDPAFFIRAEIMYTL